MTGKRNKLPCRYLSLEWKWYNDRPNNCIPCFYALANERLLLKVEKFYSKQFTDKEEGLMQLKEELRTFDVEVSKHSANKTARAAILLLHRALRDKVFSVYSLAAQLIRIFFAEFATDR